MEMKRALAEAPEASGLVMNSRTFSSYETALFSPRYI